MTHSHPFQSALLLVICLVFSGFTNAQVNPDFVYMYKGQPIERGISLGDPKNWSVQIQNRTGESADNKIAVAPTDYKETGDAIQLTWNKKNIQGNFAIYGNTIDLSKYKDVAYITLDIRLDKKPEKNVNIGMDCGYPCRAEMSLNGLIKKMPKGEWFSLPIPLNCFKGENFDLSKITSPITLSTDGRFGLSITNIRLEKMPADDKGCINKK